MFANTFEIILILLVAAVFVSAIFSRLHIPPIIGYIAVGILVSPHGFALIPSTNITTKLAEFGVVFLMFTIGLEFSLSKLWAMKHIVLIYGFLQVLISTLVTVVLGTWIGMTLSQSIVVGGVVALSSTAIVTKQLTDQLELNLPHGTNSVGILLFQDLAVIPLLILIPSLAASTHGIPLGSLGLAAIKGIVSVAAILAIGHWLLRPLFREIASTQSRELFTLCILLVTLGSAWLTHSLSLSLALGAFLAGIMLGETEFRHQIETDIRPFRDVLLGLFFISIGMLVDIHALIAAWKWLLLLLGALIVFKAVLIWMLGRFMGNDNAESLQTGIILAHGGEFGFAILSLAQIHKLLPEDYAQVVLGAILLTMALAPIMIRYAGPLTNLLFSRLIAKRHKNHEIEIAKTGGELSKHIIICGYGRVGKNISHFLDQEEIPYIALDLNPKRIQESRIAGDNVSYGDATHYEILSAAGLERAKALVISFANNKAAIKILHLVRHEHPNIPIIIRSADESELETLQELGATKVVPETLEASLMLVSHLLLLMNVPAQKVHDIMDETRANRYALLRQDLEQQL